MLLGQWFLVYSQMGAITRETFHHPKKQPCTPLATPPQFSLLPAPDHPTWTLPLEIQVCWSHAGGHAGLTDTSSPRAVCVPESGPHTAPPCPVRAGHSLG